MNLAATALTVTVMGTLVSCGIATGDDDSVVLVLAASSLTDAFSRLEVAFEDAHDDIDIDVSFAGSSAVRVQVEEGAPAGVVALANEELMDALVDAELATDPRVFATNSLVIVVPKGNPGMVSSIADFEDSDLLLGACAPQLPCGDYARTVFDRAGIEPALDTEEPDVRTLAGKVAADELDAAIVYRTDFDALFADLERVDLPAELTVRAQYPIAVTDDEAGSAMFVDFVLSDEGQAILTDTGFTAP